MDDAHIVHLLRPRYPKIIQKGLGPELSICRWGPLSADPAASTCPSVRKIRTKGLVRALCCVRACPVSLISPMLDYVNEQWSSDLMSALFPSQCPRPLDRGSNQAHTSEESSPRIVRESQIKDRVKESQRIVSQKPIGSCHPGMES